MRASLETGGVPLRLRYRPKRPRRPEIYVLCDVSTSVTSASVFFLSVLHALHDSFRKLRSFVFIERISEVTEIFEHERDFRRSPSGSPRRAGSPTSPATPTTAGSGSSSARRSPRSSDPRSTVIVLGDARTNGREPHAETFGRDRRARRPHLLAQPRAEALLELRRLGDGGVRALLRRRLRVLDHQAPGELRQRDRRRGTARPN